MDTEKVKKMFWGKNLKFIIILIVVGLVIIFLPDFSASSKDEVDISLSGSTDNLEYARALEARVKNIVERLDGAGTCEVMITLESGTEQVFAVESRENKTQSSDSQRVSSAYDSERSILTVSSAGGQQPIIVRQDEPKVRGVVIACEGADNQNTALKITEAVKTLFSIPSSSICVIKLST